MNREQALEQIQALMREHGLTTDDLQAGPSGHSSIQSTDDPASTWLRPVLATLGGLFVLAGLVATFALIWDELAALARVVVVLGSGVVALILGVVTTTRPHYDRVVSVLFLLAGLFQTWGLFVFFAEYSISVGDDLGPLLIFSAMALQFAALFVWQKRLELLFCLIGFASISFLALGDQLGIDWELSFLVLGISGMLISWLLESTRFKVMCGFLWWVYVICFSAALYSFLRDEFPLDLLLIGAGAVLVQISVMIRRRSVLALSVLVLLSYLAYYTDEYFADTLGWPIALILFGAVLLAASGYAIKLGQKMGSRE